MDITTLERMIENGRDSAMLRLTLARLMADADRLDEAIRHLETAVEQDPGYTAAWKELGRLHSSRGEDIAAENAWRKGIDVAVANGDKQAEREMGVFLKRLARARDG